MIICLPDWTLLGEASSNPWFSGAAVRPTAWFNSYYWHSRYACIDASGPSDSYRGGIQGREGLVRVDGKARGAVFARAHSRLWFSPSFRTVAPFVLHFCFNFLQSQLLVIIGVETTKDPPELPGLELQHRYMAPSVSTANGHASVARKPDDHDDDDLSSDGSSLLDEDVLQ